MAKRSALPMARSGGELRGTAADKLQSLRNGKLQPAEMRQAVALLRGTGVFSSDKQLYGYLQTEGVRGLRFKNDRIMVPAVRRRPEGDTLFIEGLTRAKAAAVAKAVGGFSFTEQYGTMAMSDDHPVVTAAKARELLLSCREPRTRLAEAVRLPILAAVPLHDRPTVHATQTDPYWSLDTTPDGIRALPKALRALQPAFRGEAPIPTTYRYRENRLTGGLSFIVAERHMLQAHREVTIKPSRQAGRRTSQHISLTHEAWFAISPEARDDIFDRPPKSEALLGGVAIKAMASLLEERMDAVDQCLPVASAYVLHQQWPGLRR